VAWIAVLVLALAAFAPGLSGGFFFDDNPNIVSNNAIQIEDLTLSSLKGSLQGPTAGPLGRPVSVLSFALTHYFFGLDPFAFKAINLAIHGVNAMLVAWLVALLLRRLRGIQLSENARVWLPVWVAAIWLIHPINVVPVMLAVQRMTLLSGMFMLLALISHLKGISKPPGRAKWGWLAAGWLVFWPLSVLSKETGFLFPLYVLVITLFSGTPAVSVSARQRWVIPAALLSLAVIAAAMVSLLGWSWLDTAYSAREFSLPQRLLTEARVLWFYAAQIVIPDYGAFALYHDDLAISTDILHPTTTLLAVIGWVAVILGILRFRHQQPILCLAAAWFLAGHTLESTILPLEIAHEYRNYLPSLGLLVGVAYLGAAVLQKLRLDHPQMTFSLVAIIPVLVLALFTWLRSDQLANPLVGSQIEAGRHPQSARANYSAALALIQAGYGDAGDPIAGHFVQYYLKQAGAADFSFKLGYVGLIVWSCASGRTVERGWIDELARRLEHTPMSPADADIPDTLLKPLLSMPQCLDRGDAFRLFTAGADNSGANRRLRAKFLEDASTYELLVALDPGQARDLLARASALLPDDQRLRERLEEFELPTRVTGKRRS